MVFCLGGSQKPIAYTSMEGKSNYYYTGIHNTYKKRLEGFVRMREGCCMGRKRMRRHPSLGVKVSDDKLLEESW